MLLVRPLGIRLCCMYCTPALTLALVLVFNLRRPPVTSDFNRCRSGPGLQTLLPSKPNMSHVLLKLFYFISLCFFAFRFNAQLRYYSTYACIVATKARQVATPVFLLLLLVVLFFRHLTSVA